MRRRSARREAGAVVWGETHVALAHRQAGDRLGRQAQPRREEQLVVPDPAHARQELPAVAVDSQDRRVDDRETAGPESGVRARDSVERRRAEDVAEDARREDEERRLLEQDHLDVRGQAPNGERAADPAEGGAEDDEPPAAGRAAERAAGRGRRRRGLGPERAGRGRRERRASERSEREEPSPGQGRAGAALGRPLSAA